MLRLKWSVSPRLYDVMVRNILYEVLGKSASHHDNLSKSSVSKRPRRSNDMINMENPIAMRKMIHAKRGKRFWALTALCVSLGIVAVVLAITHWRHVWPQWPFLLLLACPLMHLFMHHGHGAHDMPRMAAPTGTDPTSSDEKG